MGFVCFESFAKIACPITRVKRPHRSCYFSSLLQCILRSCHCQADLDPKTNQSHLDSIRTPGQWNVNTHTLPLGHDGTDTLGLRHCSPPPWNGSSGTPPVPQTNLDSHPNVEVCWAITKRVIFQTVARVSGLHRVETWSTRSIDVYSVTYDMNQ